MSPSFTTRRFRPIQRNQARTYQRDEALLGDVFYAPRKASFARPRSKALVDPMGAGPAPWLQTKEDMHVRGVAQVGGGAARPFGCHVPPLGWRGSWVWLTARDQGQAHLTAWGRRQAARAAPLKAPLLAPTDVAGGLRGAGQALWGASPLGGWRWGALPAPSLTR